ncbi:hypothetical protein [Zoogloea sp.]|uniref:hypothetical protein n=1 Tax=Zoogloea sp. TaxID=49181 RepID=UPI00261E1BB8|nr:hypothetical protein [Zoogloea sp.]
MSEKRTSYVGMSRGAIDQAIQNLLDDLKIDWADHELKECCAQIFEGADKQVVASLMEAARKRDERLRSALKDGENAFDRAKALHALHQRGLTLKQWCEKHGFGYRTASDVLNGRNQAKYGIGKTVADKLNRIVLGAE